MRYNFTINNYKLYVQCKRTKKEVVENADKNIEDSVRYKAELVGQLFQLANFCKKLQAKTVGEKYCFNVNIN